MIKLSYNSTLYSYDGNTEVAITNASKLGIEIHSQITDLSSANLIYEQEGVGAQSVALIDNLASIPGVNLKSGPLTLYLQIEGKLSNGFTVRITKLATPSGLVDDDPVFTVDRDRRIIAIPDTQAILAVARDTNSEIIKFKFPRYADGIDLSTKTAYVNFVNAVGNAYKSLLSAPQIDGDYVLVSWIVGEYVTVQEGNILFQVEFFSKDYRWQTQVAQLSVVRSLEAEASEPLQDQTLLEEYLVRFNELIAVAGERLDSLSEEKVSLPKDTDGNVILGTMGWYAVSDGAGGIIWVKSAPSGGGETTNHSIVWNLVNVSSSNNAVSVSNGASLVAVLTPADGYTLGTPTITMGGVVITGAWNADTSTITIPSVTGDVIISCSGVRIQELDTSPIIEVSGKGINSAGRVYANENWGYTKFYEVNDTSITMLGTNTKGVGGPTSNAVMTVLLDTDDGTTPFTIKDYVNPLSKVDVGKEISHVIPDGTTGLRATILLAEIDNYYCFETNTGKVIYAGKNTPYYGMQNINGTTGGSTASAGLSFDDDIAQNYAVATASILGGDTAADPNKEYGISADLAAVIDEARTAWMTEYGGDYRKIPLVITTDQHGRTNSGIFNMLGKTLSLHDVSKVINLGDTVSVEWHDEDTTKPLVSCAQLEKWCESIKAIPFSKRLDVYGNHDTWYGNYDDAGNTIGTRYPANLSHLDQYFRNIYARRNNNNGWFVIRDDYFNVKYVVVSGFEYDGGVTFRIGTKQMQFIIDEFIKDDGYDIVVVSHVPLYYQPSTEVYPTGMTPSDAGSATVSRLSNVDTDTLFNARKNKTSGTVTDSDGVEHNFDFSNCTTDILCGLHGHIHMDGYNYVGGSGLVNVTFDWFADNTLHFVLIDRVNRQLNVWKVDSTNTVQNYQVPMDKPAE